MITITIGAAVDEKEWDGAELVGDSFLRSARLVGDAQVAGVGVRALCVSRGGWAMETEAEVMPPHNALTWRELVRRLAPDLERGEPAAVEAIARTESSLGLRLPSELAEFLVEADGLTDRFGSAVVFTAAEIARRNAEFPSFEGFREVYMPFSHLLLVGEEGGGDLFADAVDADGSIRKNDLFRWEHETDGRPWYASHLVQYLESRLSDQD